MEELATRWHRQRPASVPLWRPLVARTVSGTARLTLKPSNDVCMPDTCIVFGWFACVSWLRLKGCLTTRCLLWNDDRVNEELYRRKALHLVPGYHVFHDRPSFYMRHQPPTWIPKYRISFVNSGERYSVFAISGKIRWTMGSWTTKKRRHIVPKECSFITVLLEYCFPRWYPFYTWF